jgi:hypothetical protein
VLLTVNTKDRVPWKWQYRMGPEVIRKDGNFSSLSLLPGEKVRMRVGLKQT